MSRLRIDNRTARWLWLEAQGLASPPIGAPPLETTLGSLGFVQLDSIRVVARAHHHILWSRDQTYRPDHLHALAFAGTRGGFEHFGHDACLLPMESYPYWTRQFRRFGSKLGTKWWMARLPDARGRQAILDQIAEDGPMCSADFPAPAERPRGMWERPPTKLALDWLWYTGALSTSHRVGFRKYYDLSERIVPTYVRQAEVDDAAQIDWLCREALRRLGWGTTGDIKRFWEAVDTAEAAQWVEDTELVPVSVEDADGSWRAGLALPGIEDRLAALTPPTSRLRVLNPFDPALRDRKRLRRLFGFDYVNEIFVPKAKRRWGYYVYPILEGDRLTGRVDLSGSPTRGTPRIALLWWEARVADTPRRRARLDAELARMARLRA